MVGQGAQSSCAPHSKASPPSTKPLVRQSVCRTSLVSAPSSLALGVPMDDRRSSGVAAKIACPPPWCRVATNVELQYKSRRGALLGPPLLCLPSPESSRCSRLFALPSSPPPHGGLLCQGTTHGHQNLCRLQVASPRHDSHHSFYVLKTGVSLENKVVLQLVDRWVSQHLWCCSPIVAPNIVHANDPRQDIVSEPVCRLCCYLFSSLALFSQDDVVAPHPLCCEAVEALVVGSVAPSLVM